MNDQTLENLLRDPVNTGITLVFALLATVALFYVHKLTNYLADLAGVKISDAQHQEIDDAVMKGIAYAEEQAHKAVSKTSSQEKLQIAETAARSIAPKALAETSSEQFQVRAEAALQSVRPLMTAPTSSSMPPPHHSLNPSSLRIGAPGVVPRASKVPTFDSDPPTPAESPKAKR